jgi:predicted TIM-barrel enzyme
MNEQGSSRRGFLSGALLGAAGGAFAHARFFSGRVGESAPAPGPSTSSTSSASSSSSSPSSPTLSPFLHPLDKLARMGPLRRRLWPVSYVGKPGGGPATDDVLADLDAALAGGADALVLINEFKIEGNPKTQFSTLADLEKTLEAARKRHPAAPLGVNWLGDEKDPYGWREGFRLARAFGLAIVWTDFSGVDLIKEAPRADLHEIQAARPRDVFYASGIHMKYSTLLDPEKTIEESALQAMGWVDGIIVTGPKTGVASDPEVVRRARAVIGRYPLGVASGTTAENVGSIREHIDFCLVHTGIQENHRLVASKVKALREALDRSA